MNNCYWAIEVLETEMKEPLDYIVMSKNFRSVQNE